MKETQLSSLKRKLYFNIFIAVIVVPFFIVMFGEIFTALFNSHLKLTVFQSALSAFKPLVYVLYIVVVSFYFFVITRYLKPLLNFILKGEQTQAARTATIKISLFLLVINPLFWFLSVLVFYGINGWIAPGGVPLIWLLLLKVSEGFLSALFTILIINNSLLEPKIFLRMTNVGSEEKDLFVEFKDYWIMGLVGLNFVVHLAYVVMYFTKRDLQSPGLAEPFAPLMVLGVIFSLIGLALVWLSRRETNKETEYLRSNLIDLNESEQADLSSEMILLNFNRMGELIALFNRFIRKIEERFRGVMEVAPSVDQSVEEVDQAANVFARGVESQANATEEMLATLKSLVSNLERVKNQVEDQFNLMSTVSLSIEKLSGGVESIVANTAEIRQQASVNLESAQNGIDTVGESVNHLHQMNNNLTNISKKIKKVGEETLNIDGILETIQNIADQTDMLSMNAAIEAAHAGKAGEGFSIVAAEIRKLAEVSSESVRQIASFIDNIKKSVAEAVSMAEKSEMTAREGELSSDNARASLQTIVNYLQETDKMSENIENLAMEQGKRAVEVNQGTAKLKEVSENIRLVMTEQSQGAEQVVQTMQSIAEENQKERDASKNLFQQVEHLREQSYELKTLVSAFQVGNKNKSEEVRGN